MAGFSLLEALVSMVLTVTVLGAVVPLVGANSVIATTAPEMADEQQRARIGADALFHDLVMAGSGPSVGLHAGSLLRAFAPIVPRKVGLTGPDAYNVARADAITIIYVPDTRAESVLKQGMTHATDPMQVDPAVGCPRGTQVCGFQQGSTALLSDGTGRYDLVSILSLQPPADSASVEHRQQGVVDFVYSPGASVTEAESHTYYFDRNSLQLRHADGAHADVPLLDNVVDVSFQYFGDPNPPLMPRPPAGVANCLYDAAGNRLAGMSTLASSGAAVVALPLTLFTDGPWCAAGSNRFDADLLRIRLVRVVLRVQVGNLMLRGTSSDFSIAGRSRNAARQIADYTIRFDVAPRGMTGAPQ